MKKMKNKRKPWHNYFMEIAEKVSERSTCDRLRVGCILVKNKRIISTGYNGALSKQPHCDEVGHLIVNDHCVRVVHAEACCITMAAKFGISTEGSVAYCNWHPCLNCLKLLIAAGIKAIYYKAIYKPERMVDYPEEILNIIPLEQLK